MYPPDVTYSRPQSIDEAISALSQPEARILAGGHSLLTGLKQRSIDAQTLVDIGDLDALRGIERDEDGLHIGGGTRYVDILSHPSISSVAPSLVEAVAAVGDRQIRNRGTIGGNLVQADPGADVPAAALAVDATVTIRGPDDERTCGIADIYQDTTATGWERAAAIGPDELLTGVHIPSDPAIRGAYVRKTHPSRGYATIGVAVRVRTDGTSVERARIAATGLTRSPQRLTGAEEALIGKSLEDADCIEDAADRADEGIDRDDVIDDPNVSAGYRVDILGPYVTAALERVREGGKP